MKKISKDALLKSHQLEHEDEPIEDIREMRRKSLKDAETLGKILKKLTFLKNTKKANSSSRKKKTL